jgi:hypothetical protein
MRFVMLFILFLPIAAAAQDASKSWTVDMTTPILDEEGVPIKDTFDRKAGDDACAKCRDLTIGAAAAHALLIVGQDDRDVTVEQKWSWAFLAERLRHDKAAKIDNATGDLLYRRIGKMYSGLVLLRIMPLLDPNKPVPAVR